MGRGFPPGMPNFGMPPMGMHPGNPLMPGMNPAFARGRVMPNMLNPANRYARRPNGTTNTEPIIPPHLEHLFQARPPLNFIAPIEKKKPQPYTGLSSFVNFFETTEERTQRIANEPKTETPQEKRDRKKREKRERSEKKIQEQITSWDPKHDTNAKSDPRKTLFIGRLNFSTNEDTLRRKMEQFGRVKRVNVVHNIKSGKPRGYAFIEFDKERELKEAYDRADGMKIDDKRIVVDFERGRLDKDWRPRRLGGGLGGTRIGGKDVNQTHSGRKPPSEDHVIHSSRDRERDRYRGRDNYRNNDRERERRDKYEEYERHGGGGGGGSRSHRTGHHR